MDTIVNERIAAFHTLGTYLRSAIPYLTDDTLPHTEPSDPIVRNLVTAARKSKNANGWFTIASIQSAWAAWAEQLTESHLVQWVEKYTVASVSPKTVYLILAGNIPMVGFHDLLSVLICGHKALVKLSSKDLYLISAIADVLIQIAPQFEKAIEIVTTPQKMYDAVIATGSTNTARYFEYYFADKPHIIRKNRTSIAILDGTETNAQLELLGKDIFQYFGLGCRNVSQLVVPENYDFTLFFEAMYSYKDVIYHSKYANNYDYNKAVYLMSNFKLLDNEFMILKEDDSLYSPISVIYYTKYKNRPQVEYYLKKYRENIQCVVSHGSYTEAIPFGTTQSPTLDTYADNVDTLRFLTKL